MIAGRDPTLAKGFTLLETVVALAILAIVLVSVYKMQGQTILMQSSATFFAEAPMLANRVLAEFDAEMDRERFRFGEFGEFDEPFASYRWSVSQEEAVWGLDAADLELLQKAGIQESALEKNFFRLEIEIERSDDGQVFRLEAYRFPRPE